MYARPRGGVALAAAVVSLLATVLAIGPVAAEPGPTEPAEGPTTAMPDDGGGAITPSSAPIAGEYIVTLANDISASSVRATANDLVAEHDGDLLHTYKHALQGFAAELSEAEALALSQDPRVAAVEENGEVHAVTTQTPATQGLDRIDQRDLPLNNSYTYNATGAGVDAYIIDTGIRFTHNEFGGRASLGVDEIVPSTGGVDCQGHGTHVAGTVGGTTFGVAKAVSLIAVRVLDCSGSGSNAGVIAGVDWVTANNSGPSVANMSLGGGASTALDTAVQNSIADGTTYALAAGNDSGANACNGSPGRTPEAITVGSTTVADARSSFSNIGTCLDIFAPGSNITSAWGIGDDTTLNTISGTSMATPHVAGAAALFLQTAPASTPAQVAARLIADSTLNHVTDPGTGSPNRLLYTGSIVLGASIKIVQDSIPDSPQDFTYSGCQGAGCSTWALDDDTNGALPRQVEGVAIPTGTYVITQSAVPGWSLDSIVCNTGETVDLANRRVTIDLTTNEQVTCTFTDKTTSITIVQDSAPDSPQPFLFTGCSGGCGAAFPLDDDETTATPSSGTGTALAPGTYTVTQAAVANWTLSSLVCNTGESVNLVNRSATITLTAGENVVCTWTNTSASITIVQDTVPDNAQDFAYSGCQGAGCSAFTLDDDPASATVKSVTGAGIAPGTYTVTQSGVAGWELFTLACNTGEAVDLLTRQVTITLAANEQVTCTFSNRVANDSFANAVLLSGASGSFGGTTTGTTKEAGEPNHGGNAGGRSVWFRWVAPASGTVTFDTCGGSTNYDTLLASYTGAAVNALTLVAGNDDNACGSFHSLITFPATSGVTYRVAVDGFAAASGNFTLDWALT